MLESRATVLFDSDVLIWAIRRHAAALDLLESCPERTVSVVSCMEILAGARDKRELAVLRGFLTKFQRLPLTREIGHRAERYVELYALKSAVSPLDALIAATAVENHLPLCTANVKHFRSITDLELHPFKP